MVDPDTPGDYSYNVTCGSGPCSDKATGTVTVVEACTATAPDFSICVGTTVNDNLFISHGASCSAGCNMTLDYSGVDPDTPGDYSYNVTCGSGLCSDNATGTVTVVEACAATAPNFSICVGTTLNEQLFIDNGANCSAGCNMTLDYSGVDPDTPGDYSYNVTCGSGPCSDKATGTVTAVEACTATAPDFSICAGTTVNDQLFEDHGASCSVGCNMTLDYSFDGSSAGIYSYNVTCNGGACGDDVSTGNVTVIECAGPLLTISKSDFPEPVQRGGTLTYNIIISNDGAVNATDVNVVDDYDEPILTITDAGDGTVSEPPDTITWNGGITVPAGGSVSYTVTASVNPTAAGGTIFYNTANVTCAEGVSSSITIDTTVRTAVIRRGGGGGGGEVKYLTVDFEGKITKKRLDSNDRLIETLIGPSPDGRHSLEIEKGTQSPIADGKRIYLIVIRESEEPLPLPECTAVAGAVYNITPSGTVFDKDVILTLGFNPMELTATTVSSTMAYYVPDEGWRPLESKQGGVAELGTMSAAISHFTPFAILVELECAPPPPPPLPAHFVTSGLNIVPSIREIWEPITFVTKTGETATITATVANDGEQEGTYLVELKINGKTVDTKELVLGAGQSQPVSFTLSGIDYGHYMVEVAELSGKFTVSQTINWWLIIGIIAAIGLITWGVVWGRRRRRAT